ncbi:unnamed protein product [Notodromas monacha]|uniref:DDB1- and CUL4-associated factor 12 beta-propeller domain-containing protein n=1 Tax=Notodromas monacha TaxID=399045 RepID=A0A7R9BQP8_9CRUS|nr:unnamed protein product [Notodromas monacha]CAG0919936.1 unnamed protein product [Notodromas monacha]
MSDEKSEDFLTQTKVILRENLDILGSKDMHNPQVQRKFYRNKTLMVFLVFLMDTKDIELDALLVEIFFKMCSQVAGREALLRTEHFMDGLKDLQRSSVKRSIETESMLFTVVQKLREHGKESRVGKLDPSFRRKSTAPLKTINAGIKSSLIVLKLDGVESAEDQEDIKKILVEVPGVLSFYFDSKNRDRVNIRAKENVSPLRLAAAISNAGNFLCYLVKKREGDQNENGEDLLLLKPEEGGNLDLSYFPDETIYDGNAPALVNTSFSVGAGVVNTAASWISAAAGLIRRPFWKLIPEKMEWMYKGPGQSSADKEEYLLGKPIDKTFEESHRLGGSIVDATPAPLLGKIRSESRVDVDLARKVTEDPLVKIRLAERDKLKHARDKYIAQNLGKKNQDKHVKQDDSIDDILHGKLRRFFEVTDADANMDYDYSITQIPGSRRRDWQTIAIQATTLLTKNQVEEKNQIIPDPSAMCLVTILLLLVFQEDATVLHPLENVKEYLLIRIPGNEDEKAPLEDIPVLRIRQRQGNATVLRVKPTSEGTAAVHLVVIIGKITRFRRKMTVLHHHVSRKNQKTKENVVPPRGETEKKQRSPGMHHEGTGWILEMTDQEEDLLQGLRAERIGLMGLELGLVLLITTGNEVLITVGVYEMVSVMRKPVYMTLPSTAHRVQIMVRRDNVSDENNDDDGGTRGVDFRVYDREPDQSEIPEALYLDASSSDDEIYEPTEDSDDFANCRPRYRVETVSKNFVDYHNMRQMGAGRFEYYGVEPEYATRYLLTHNMLSEQMIRLDRVDKIFSAEWLSDRQVVFGTKCNKLMVYNAMHRKVERIPSLARPTLASVGNNVRKRRKLEQLTALVSEPRDVKGGIHAVRINKSRTLLVTGGQQSCDVAVYALPTFDPVFVGAGAHDDLIFDIAWIDEQVFVSGSRDSSLAMWKVNSKDLRPAGGEDMPRCELRAPILKRKCKMGEKVRTMGFNSKYPEIVAISMNAFLHIFDPFTLKQKYSRRLPHLVENVCIAVDEVKDLYAIGSKSHTTLIDGRTLTSTDKISSRMHGWGIRSLSFLGDLLTMGTGNGQISFYDLRARKYLESSIHTGRFVTLKTSSGTVLSNDPSPEALNGVDPQPAIYTHCYDYSGTRLFAAGGPLQVGSQGNYASVWQ